ncbi:MAG: MFS transporter [Anaerolineae bacterium]|nr:MFS transporter [Anaerolineae bacterium]
MSDAVESTAPAARPSLLSALSLRDFRLVWLGEGVSLLGDQIYLVAVPWLTLQLTGSGLALGLVSAATALPRAIFMLLGGAVTDRFSPRRVMLASNIMRMVLTALLCIAVLTETIQLWMLFVSALLFGTADAFFYPAQNSIVPQIVGRDQIESGNALVQITAQLASFFGPALGGLIIANLSGAADLSALEAAGRAPEASGIGAAIALNSLSFLVAAVALTFMRSGNAASSTASTTRQLLASIAEGLRVVWSDPVFRVIVLLTASINFCIIGPISVGMPMLADTRYAEGAAALGAIYSSFGGGALLGVIIGGSTKAPRRMGVIVMSLITLLGVMWTTYSIPLPLGAAVAVGVVIGLTVGYSNVVMISWLQKRTDPELLGRVMSIVMLGSVGLGPISSMLAGVLVEVNLGLLFAVSGALLILFAASALANPHVRAIGGE